MAECSTLSQFVPSCNTVDVTRDVTRVGPFPRKLMFDYDCQSSSFRASAPPAPCLRPKRQADLRHIRKLLARASVATMPDLHVRVIGNPKEALQRSHPQERANLNAKDKDDDPDGCRDS